MVTGTASKSPCKPITVIPSRSPHVPQSHWPDRVVLQGVDASNPLGCSAAPSLRVLKYLDRICDDCYMLYRDPGVYTMCRSDCYNNRFFLGCMDVMMVSKKVRSRAANFVTMINSPTSR